MSLLSYCSEKIEGIIRPYLERKRWTKEEKNSLHSIFDIELNIDSIGSHIIDKLDLVLMLKNQHRQFLIKGGVIIRMENTTHKSTSLDKKIWDSFEIETDWYEITYNIDSESPLDISCISHVLQDTMLKINDFDPDDTTTPDSTGSLCFIDYPDNCCKCRDIWTNMKDRCNCEQCHIHYIQSNRVVTYTRCKLGDLGIVYPEKE